MFYVAIRENGEIVAHLAIARTRATIGREADNDLIIQRATVSSHHAELIADQDGFSIRDLRSTNGTWINNVRVSEAVRFGPNDRVRVAHFGLEVAWAPFPQAFAFFNRLDRTTPEMPGVMTTEEMRPPSAEDVAAARQAASWPPVPPRKEEA